MTQRNQSTPQNPEKVYEPNHTGMFRKSNMESWHKCHVIRQEGDTLYVVDGDAIDDSIDENAERPEIAVNYRDKKEWIDNVHDFVLKETAIHQKAVYEKGYNLHLVTADGNCFYRLMCIAMGKSSDEHMNIRREVIQYARDNATCYIPLLSLIRGRSVDATFTTEEYERYLKRHEGPSEPATQFEMLVTAARFSVQIDCFRPDPKTGKLRDSNVGAKCAHDEPCAVINALHWVRRKHFDLIITGVEGHFPDANGRGFKPPNRPPQMTTAQVSMLGDVHDTTSLRQNHLDQQRDDDKTDDDVESDDNDGDRIMTDDQCPSSTLRNKNQSEMDIDENCTVATGIGSQFTTTEYYRRDVGTITPHNQQEMANPTVMLDELGNQLWDDDEDRFAQRGPVKLRYMGHDVMKEWKGPYKNMYICAGCHQSHARRTGKPFENANIKKYLVRYLCPTCQDDAERLEVEHSRDKQKKDRIMFREYKCIEDGCPGEHSVSHKSWKGKRAFINWDNHYRSKHPTTEYLEITGNHICRGEGCSKVLSNKNDLCRRCGRQEQDAESREDLNRSQRHSRNSRSTRITSGPSTTAAEPKITNVTENISYVLDEDRDDIIIDGDGVAFDIKTALHRVEQNAHFHSESAKDEAARFAVKCINKMAGVFNNLDGAIDGALGLRMFGLAFHHLPFRGDNKMAVIAERKKRIEMLKSRKYSKLMQRAITEQNKRDAKRRRQKLRSSIARLPPSPSIGARDQRTRERLGPIISIPENGLVPDEATEANSNMGALCDVLSHLNSEDIAIHEHQHDEEHLDDAVDEPVGSSAISEPSQNNTTTIPRRGSIYYQTAHVTRKQLQNIITQSQCGGDFDRAPRFLFGDNDEDFLRDKYTTKRNHNGGQARVMGEFDDSNAYGLMTTFYMDKYPEKAWIDVQNTVQSQSGIDRTLNNMFFQSIMNNQFIEVRNHLLSGRDIIVPCPSLKDIKQHPEKYLETTDSGQQVLKIAHNLGTGLARLPPSHLAHIQSKLGELEKFASKTLKLKDAELYMLDVNEHMEIDARPNEVDEEDSDMVRNNSRPSPSLLDNGTCRPPRGTTDCVEESHGDQALDHSDNQNVHAIHQRAVPNGQHLIPQPPLHHSRLPLQTLERESAFCSNELSRDIDGVRWTSEDTNSDLKDRMRRCVRYGMRGHLRKANQALFPSKIGDLDDQKAWECLKSKFPEEGPVEIPHIGHRPHFNLSFEDIERLILSLNDAASPGPDAFTNELFIWIVKRNDKYHLVEAVRRYLKVHLRNVMPKQMRKLGLYTMGLSFVKPKKTFDLRPIGILSSLERLVDKCSVANVLPEDRRAAIGPYQCTDISQGTQVATLVVDHQCELIKNIPGEVIYTEDVKNAFNSVNRQEEIKLVLKKVPDLAYHWVNLYSVPTIIDYDNRHRIYMTSGNLQGATSSGFLYNVVKWDIQQRALEAMNKIWEEFRISSAFDYYDDGNRTMQIKYVYDWIKCQQISYSKYGLQMNLDKTKMVMNTNDSLSYQGHIDKIKTLLKESNLIFDGSIESLGVPHGPDTFINEVMAKRLNPLMKTVKMIELIRDPQIKHNLYTRFLDYNKIQYSLQTTRRTSEWVQTVCEIYRYIKWSLTAHIQHTPTMKFQLPLRQRSGGFGLRPTQLLIPAARITTLAHKSDIISEYFNFDKIPLDNTANNNDERQSLSIDSITPYSKCYRRTEMMMNHELQSHIDTINNFLDPIEHFELGPDRVFLDDIFKKIDKVLLHHFDEIATPQDKARIKSLSGQGATTWLNASKMAVRFTPLQFHLMKALYLGAPIRPNNKCCIKCGAFLKAHGYHTLSCSIGNQQIMRHHRLRDVLADLFRSAGFKVDIEQKFNRRQIQSDHHYDPEVHGIPGDLKVYNWWPGAPEPDAYLDVVVGNIFAASYLPQTSQKCLYLAKLKEKMKHQKYNNHPNVIPLAIEVMGAIGPEFRRVLATLSDAIALRSNAPYSVVMERTRCKIITTMMQANCEMMITGMDLSTT